MSARSMRLFVLLTALLCSALPLKADDTDPAALVDALDGVFGKKEGKRAAHTVGTCVKGSFVPTAEAAKLSKAPHLSGPGPWPVVGRFSMGGGNPAAPNTQKDNTRGLAIHVELGGGVTTDMVMISAPVFVAKTPAKFLELLTTVATKDKEKIGDFFKANPDSARQRVWLTERPIPASYTSATYFGVHAFTLVNAAGEKQIVKWQMRPVGGEPGLSDDDAKTKAPDFYVPELKERLAKGPAEFTLFAILGEPGDPTDDPTAFWPEGRKEVEIAKLSITALEDDATCDANIFDPTNVADGIEGPANDQIFPMRSAAYAVSFSRRVK